MGKRGGGEGREAFRNGMSDSVFSGDVEGDDVRVLNMHNLTSGSFGQCCGQKHILVCDK